MGAPKPRLGSAFFFGDENAVLSCGDRKARHAARKRLAQFLGRAFPSRLPRAIIAETLPPVTRLEPAGGADPHRRFCAQLTWTGWKRDSHQRTSAGDKRAGGFVNQVRFRGPVNLYASDAAHHWKGFGGTGSFSGSSSGLTSHMLRRLLFRFSEKRELHRLPVAVWMLSTSKDRALAFDKLDAALRLIERHAPRKLKALQKDLRSILVAGAPSFWGCYIHKLRMIELYFDYVLDDQTPPASIASTLIHEAQHARLWRLGFGYDEPIRARIERLCFRAERNFARLIPEGEASVARAEAWIEANLEPVFSIEGRRQSNLKALKKLGAPAWLIKTMAWVSRRRVDRAHSKRG